MNDILGFTFVLGPEVKPTTPIDFTRPRGEVTAARFEWQTVLHLAVQEHDAWGLLRMRPDGDVTLYDVVTPGSLWQATSRGGRIWLLLARESR